MILEVHHTVDDEARAGLGEPGSQCPISPLQRQACLALSAGRYLVHLVHSRLEHGQVLVELSQSFVPEVFHTSVGWDTWSMSLLTGTVLLSPLSDDKTPDLDQYRRGLTLDADEAGDSQMPSRSPLPTAAAA